MNTENIHQASTLVYAYKDLTKQIRKLSKKNNSEIFNLRTFFEGYDVDVSKQDLLTLLRKDRQRVRRKLTKLGVGKVT